MIDVNLKAEHTSMNSQGIPKGTLYVIAAPSGAGKTSLTRALVESMSAIEISISHTTRPQRPAEIPDKDYFFVTKSRFEEMIAAGEFLEHAKVFDYYYGTTHEWVENRLLQGIDIVLEIDWQGAKQVRELFPASVHVFILPPSAFLLRQRLQDRKQDKEDVIEQRLAAASDEMAHYKDFDYLIINNVFDKALSDLHAVVHANRLGTNRQAQRYAKLLAELIRKK